MRFALEVILTVVVDEIQPVDEILGVDEIYPG